MIKHLSLYRKTTNSVLIRAVYSLLNKHTETFWLNAHKSLSLSTAFLAAREPLPFDNSF